MASQFIAVVPHNKLKSALVYEFIGGDVWAAYWVIREACPLEDYRVTMLSPGDTLNVETHWWWPWRRVVWETMIQEDYFG